MAITRTEPPSVLTTIRPGASRWEALSGLAFVVLFVAGIFTSSPPDDNASNSSWIANYSGHGKQAAHLASGLLLVLAALALLAFLTGIWRRLAAADDSKTLNPLPVVAAAVSASCIAMGGIVMGTVGATELMNKYPLPSVDILRLSNDLGFGMVGVAGMLAAALSIVGLSVQGERLGVIGSKTKIFGIVVAVILLASMLFFPIAALLVWVVFMAVQSLRSETGGGRHA